MEDQRDKRVIHLNQITALNLLIFVIVALFCQPVFNWEPWIIDWGRLIDVMCTKELEYSTSVVSIWLTQIEGSVWRGEMMYRRNQWNLMPKRKGRDGENPRKGIKNSIKVLFVIIFIFLGGQDILCEKAQNGSNRWVGSKGQYECVFV